MLYKFISETAILPCPKNGTAGGKRISNLLRYLEKHPDIALAEGWKPLASDEEPQYNPETQYLATSYEDAEEAILKHYEVIDIEGAEE